ncbi:MAG: bifunctional phosphopantothenoylcysteine decarboxylase/phosphopantothenate--cysteine ligase CoaBC [Flavobacterium sp.]|jgi:phosphopantothenoylcysteine decarboxylase/phosphopantothenate--cysteine ligase|uniref:bifunctional phosphopantothenoylcysteine decarboxylase/phosphopantothenate--cysteine ligase CoaBC n=1 Tax=Flavobacterium sp. TaxID=239 RepID=UPI001B79550C|nr:bifunctional phosphopantothenoylcysteine decarboxylase/phosphopantothenate--cysteine ligase CoaBC [Flavobacterium sp.]MBP6146567.1 bifunctional phosphopantothenoylcysteine decarboxylase/phosphopantothenate--cysteine ligase CoaBC [Flavobacterium sp.]MBP7181586.1 bifunctional phosphopantothenoylcysteine decarboxylase/phosphopantothenate--cysteine ligase CoaBC [Flavobacterium sp.]MBP7316765.1 bifunctional phosphopantothenoylcysteine decarboxylase/phosphopantothenate--cysteine ligase CoaBC [Flavo
MSVLSGKKILLGISGGIAAYKTATLVRLFIKAGAHVQVIMTPASKDFITPLTLSTLSKNPVYSGFYNQEDENGKWNNHVELALWADMMVIAPATANTLSKMTNGTCDNLLIAVYLSAKCPVYFAPAMDLDMYIHPSTLDSFKKLEQFGNTMIPAESGELASGLSGEGRMAEPENIVAFIEADLESRLPLKGQKILITAGPTYEAIDPVRFIGNHSSGKMGFDIALSAANLGASVILVSGPTHCKVSNPLIKVVSVVSAEEMYIACHQFYADVDVAIAAAAVADYRPKNVAQQKIKKAADDFVIELEKTKDILASLGEQKKNQFLIGFALETENEIENAKLKIQKKNLDLIVLNSLQDQGAGFSKPTNKVTFIDKFFNIEPMELKTKEAVADDILNKVISHFGILQS